MYASVFSKQVPSTIILDATEVKVVQPSDPIEQQVTFSHYKNINTFKGMALCNQVPLALFSPGTLETYPEVKVFIIHTRKC